jgi:hypothetical protein
MFIEICLGLAGIGTYGALALGTMRGLANNGWAETDYRGKQERNADGSGKIGPCAFFGGIAWPVIIPMAAVYNAPKLLKKAHLPSFGTSGDTLFPGVDKPTLMLEGLVATRLLQDMDRAQADHIGLISWTSKDGKIQVRPICDGNNKYLYFVNGVCFNAEGPVAKAALTVGKTAIERERNNVLLIQEKRAVDAIESILLQPEK